MEEKIVKIRQPGLLEVMRNRMRMAHMSLYTERTYIQWIKRFLIFHNKRHPREMGSQEITAFLSELAVTKNVSASTQNQALSAIVYLYREVLKQDPGTFEGLVWAKKPKFLPTVLSTQEVRLVLRQLKGVQSLIALLIFSHEFLGPINSYLN